MITPEERFWAGSGDLRFGGPYTWYITDFDQRRTFAVTYAPVVANDNDEEVEEICFKQLRKNVDDIGDGVFGIRFTTPDGPVTFLTDPKDDVTFYSNSHSLGALELPFPVKTISLTSLTEVDRLGSLVDLVEYENQTPSCQASSSKIRAAFKYWFMDNGMFRTWYELSNWSRLPRDHPHIVPFESVVLDPFSGGIVGFTTLFIPGGTLWHNNATTRTFKMSWFRQLLSVVQDLNYRYGIMHQDIAPRNLLVDDQDNLRIFDFNYAIMIGEHYAQEYDDIKGVIFTLYEIITLDDHYRTVPHEEQDADALTSQDWTPHPDVKLDASVAEFRHVLQTWVDWRKACKFEPRETWVRWPWMPKKAPMVQIAVRDRERNLTGTKTSHVVSIPRQDLVDMGKPFFNWERPASYKMRDFEANAGDADVVVAKEGSHKA